MDQAKTAAEMAARMENAEQVLKANNYDKARLVPILQEVQARYGWLSQDLISYVARAVGLPPARVYGVATFYSQFSLEPKGQYVVGVCLGTACYVKGSQKVLDKLSKQENSAADRCSVLNDQIDLLNQQVDNTRAMVDDYTKQVKASQKELDAALGAVVEDCVNAVGVDVNTASASLLSRVSGLTAATAKNIVKYREDNGIFPDRKRLLKVPKLGPKAFEQCAGFLRVPESRSVLDNTGVHPESYAAAEQLLALCGYTAEDVKNGDIPLLAQKVKLLGEEKTAAKLGIGLPTLRDVVKELMKPGRDVRDDLPAPILRTDVLEIKDLKAGMVLTGTVRNVIDFGVFVDIGVHQDGLVHISQVCNKFIKHPSEIVAVGDIVKVVVLEVDEKKHRISLSMKQVPKDAQ